MSASIDTGIGLSSPKEWAKTGVGYARKAIWAKDPVTQIAVNAVIIVAMMLSSAVGFVVGIPIALASLGLAGIGVLRLIFGAVM